MGSEMCIRDSLELEAQRAAAGRALADPATVVLDIGRKRGRRKSRKAGVSSAWCEVPFSDATVEHGAASDDWFKRPFSAWGLASAFIDSGSRY